MGVDSHLFFPSTHFFFLAHSKESTPIYFSLAPIFSFWPTVKRVDSHLFFPSTHFFFLAHSKESTPIYFSLAPIFSFWPTVKSRLPFIFLWHPFFLFGPQ